MKNNEKINWKEVKNIIYNHIDCKSVFVLALGFFHPTKRFKSPFRLDKKADCSFFQDKDNNNIWLFHDFAFGETYDIFRIYELTQGVEFIDCIKALAELGNCMDKMNEKGLFLRSSETLQEEGLSGKELIQRLKEQKKQQKKLMDGIKTQAYEEIRARLLEAQKLENWGKEKPVLKFEILPKFKQHHIDFWAKRFLKESNISDTVVALDSVYTEKADGTHHIVFKDSPEQPLFGYVQDGGIQQIYRPYSESKKHKFRNIGSPLIWQHSENIGLINPEKDDFFPSVKGLMIIKGFKDAIHLKYAFPNFLISGKLGETSKLSQEELKQIDIYFPDKDYPIYIWVDNDAAGIKAGQGQEDYFKELGYSNVYQLSVPLGKDIDEYIQYKKTEEWSLGNLFNKACLTFKNKI